MLDTVRRNALPLVPEPMVSRPVLRESAKSRYSMSSVSQPSAVANLMTVVMSVAQVGVAQRLGALSEERHRERFPAGVAVLVGDTAREVARVDIHAQGPTALQRLQVRRLGRVRGASTTL